MPIEDTRGYFITWPAVLLLRGLAEPEEWKLEGWCVLLPFATREVMTFPCSAAERPVLCPVLGPQCDRKVGKMEEAQRRAIERAGGLEHTEYEMERVTCGAHLVNFSVGEEGPA